MWLASCSKVFPALADPQNSLLQSFVLWYLWTLSEKAQYYFAWKQGVAVTAGLMNGSLCVCVGAGHVHILYVMLML